MNSFLTQQFGNRVRIRCMALIEQNDAILLINHSGLNPQNCFWMPPGGGIEAGENVLECIAREVNEEANLKVLKSEFYCLNEYIADSLHAVELFFKSKVADYDSQLGNDPEISSENQLLLEIEWMDIESIKKLDKGIVHPVIKKYVTCNTHNKA
ncbi:MAG: 8-oxo-dGTP diphosphatase [Spirosomataceae bacterium]|jgi:8-oxo-dGTP diphosphatase